MMAGGLFESLNSYLSQFCGDGSSVKVKKCKPCEVNKFCDLSVSVLQPSFRCFVDNIDRLKKEIPAVSESWEFRIEKVEILNSNLCFFLEKSSSYKTLFRSITDISSKFENQIECEPSSLNNKVLIIMAPQKSSFSSKRSRLYATALSRLYSSAGYYPSIHLTYLDTDATKSLDLKGNKFYNEEEQTVDLQSFIHNQPACKNLCIKSIPMKMGSPPCFLAESIRIIFLNHRDAQIVHYVGHLDQRNLLSEAVALLKLVGFCEGTQRFLFHGGTDTKAGAIEEHEIKLSLYLQSCLTCRGINQADICQILTDTKIAFDLLACRRQSRAKMGAMLEKEVSFEGKNGIFVQYTCSRLAAILRKYDKALDSGLYNGCPKNNELNSENIRFDIYSTQDEWSLWSSMFNFVDVLHNAIKLYPTEDFDTYQITEGLLQLCVQYSSFYRKIRVLIDDQPHQYPLLLCRIFFIKNLLKLIKSGLSILGLNAVTVM